MPASGRHQRQRARRLDGRCGADHRQHGRHRRRLRAPVRRRGAWVVARTVAGAGAELVGSVVIAVRFIAADVTAGARSTANRPRLCLAWPLDVLFNNGRRERRHRHRCSRSIRRRCAPRPTRCSPASCWPRASGARHARAGGVILNCSSTAAHRAGSQSAVYSALKAAVSHFTRCAALELAEHRIRVNAISRRDRDADLPEGARRAGGPRVRSAGLAATSVRQRTAGRSRRRNLPTSRPRRHTSRATRAATSPARTGRRRWPHRGCLRRSDASRRR